MSSFSSANKIELGELCHVVTKGTTPTSIGLGFADSGVPFLRIQDVKNRTVKLDKALFISDDTHKVLKRSIIKPKDFLITIAGTIGQVAIVPEEFPECNCNQALAILRFDQQRLDPIYLLNWLGTDDALGQITGKKVTGVISNLSLGQIKKLKIPLLPLKKQKIIAEILATADTLRQKNLQLVEYYNRLSQSLFLDMFGDSVANPKAWNVKKLKDLSIKIHSGSTPKGGSKVYVDKGITFFRSQNVWKNRIELDDVAYIDKVTHSNMKKSSLKYQDILMTKTGRINTENSSLGRAAIFLGEDNTANVNGHVYLIRLQEDIIKEFVLFILTSIEYRDYIRSVCVGGIDKRQLNKGHLENFPIISPPRDLQKQFVNQLRFIEEQKELAQQSLKKSDDLFNSLLQRAFRGELTNS